VDATDLGLCGEGEPEVSVPLLSRREQPVRDILREGRVVTVDVHLLRTRPSARVWVMRRGGEAMRRMGLDGITYKGGTWSTTVLRAGDDAPEGAKHMLSDTI
jgi:hypothetical protein